MGDYFKHWLSFTERTTESKLPKIFHVNWFRKNKQGKFLWPGFGDNIRVLEWILNRSDVNSKTPAIDTPIGFVPATNTINISGLDLSTESMEELCSIDTQEWLGDLKKTREFLNNFGERLPAGIVRQADQLQARLEAANKQ
jgi:phosphoenolpyruvate carboxykinase (GTP)